MRGVRSRPCRFWLARLDGGAPSPRHRVRPAPARA